MTNKKLKSDSKLKLFHAITSRISNHNHSNHQQSEQQPHHSEHHNTDHDSLTGVNIINTTNLTSERHSKADDQLETVQETQSFTHNSGESVNGQINNNINPVLNLSSVYSNQQQSSSQQLSNQKNTLNGDTSGYISREFAPTTQGSDNSNFSYLESMKRAPTKKRYGSSSRPDVITPTYTFRNKNKGIWKDSASTPTTKFGFSPAESSANSETSFAGKTESLIITDTSGRDLNGYDYRTFGTKHPLRLSKIRAFEQAELTSKTYFSTSAHMHESKHDATEEFVLRIPSLSVEETKKLFRHDTIESRVSENDSTRRRFMSLTQSTKAPLSDVERRLQMMKHSLTPLSKEELSRSKLQSSSLGSIFQQNSTFLGTLDFQEVQYWEYMNGEFETEISAMRKEVWKESRERNTLIDTETLQSIKNAMKHRKKRGSTKKDLENTLSTLVCKRVKDHLDEEKNFVLNTNM